MNRQQIYAAIVSFFVLVVFANVVNAQSKDMDNPTRLTSNEISGLIDDDSIGSPYYYSFMATRGEISIKLTVEPGKQVKYGEFSSNSVSFRLFNREGQMVLNNGVSASDTSNYYVAKTQIPQRQIMVLSVTIPSGGIYNKAVGGKYRIRIGGAVEFRQGEPTTTGDPELDEALRQSGISNDKTGKPECLPKSGTLVIRMKGGSKKTIDLSEAETITIVP
jgi:hypothetical protein